MSKIKNPFYSLCLVLLLFSCSRERTNWESNEVLFGLASPVLISTYQGDTTTIVLADYFIHPEKIDSVTIPQGFKLITDTIRETISLLPTGTGVTNPGFLRIWTSGDSYDLPLKTRYKKELRLSVAKTSDTENVQFAGDFNGWKPGNGLPSAAGDSMTFTTTLTPGNYGYKLVRNGRWVNDPRNPDSLSNGQGGYNSLLKVDELSREDVPQITTRSFHDNTFTITLQGNREPVAMAWIGNHLLGEPERSGDGGSVNLTWTIPSGVANLKRAYIRVYCHNRLTSGNDLLIPLENGKIITHASDLDRQDLESNILYFLMVDRFANGDPANDYHMDTLLVKPKAQYMGGDLQGILDKLKAGFFDSLGINALWVSPITQNPMGAWGQFRDPDTRFSGYHGYWPITLTTVDTRFGDRKVLDELLDEAHKRGMNVYLDYVAHHLHIEHPVIKKNPDWVTPLYLPDGTMNTERWDDHRLTTWFDTFMPTLNLVDQKITNYMVDSALFWVKDVKFDGFRHDATKHIPLNFWRTLTGKIKTEVEIPGKKRIYQIGETYGNNDLISSYVNSGMLDAQFDFNLYDALLPVMTNPNESFTRLSKTLKQSFTYYGYHHLMGNITGNQDKPRFISWADGSITSDMPWQETKRLGWKQTILVKDPKAYARLACAQAFNLTIPGIPVIYYGDEFGMPGANDPDNRRMMKFNGLLPGESDLQAQVKQLISLRRTEMPLLYGDFTELSVSDQVYAYSRTYFNETIWVIINKSDQPQTFTHPALKAILKNLGGSTAEVRNNALQATLPPVSYSIIKWTTP